MFADCDLRRGLHAKRWFDAVGHYSRAEVLDGAAAAAGDGADRRPAGRPGRSGRGHRGPSDEDLTR